MGRYLQNHAVSKRLSSAVCLAVNWHNIATSHSKMLTLFIEMTFGLIWSRQAWIGPITQVVVLVQYRATNTALSFKNCCRSLYGSGVSGGRLNTK